MKNKKMLFFTTILSLVSVFAGAISTFAWFQINSQAPEANILTHDPNLTINNSAITGYKIEHTLGADGFIDRSSSTVSAKQGEMVSTTNTNQNDADIDFDVPSQGTGYYLVKKNPSGSFKYVYDNTSYALKFTERMDTTINNMVAYDSTFCNFSVGDVLRIRNYAYNSSTYSTVNSEISGLTIGLPSTRTYLSLSPNSGSKTNYEINIITEGQYKIWFNKTSKNVEVELLFNASEKNVASSSSFAKPIQDTIISKNNKINKAGGATAASNTVYMLYDSQLYKDSARMWMIAIDSNHTEGNWYEFEDSGYKFNDKTIYKCTHNTSLPYFKIIRRNSAHTQTVNWTNELTFSSSKNYCTFSSYSGDVINFSQSAFSSVIYDGWILIGKSGTGSSTFGTGDFTVADAKRLESSDGNLGKISLTLNPGDSFKIAYLKNEIAGEWEGADKLEVYYNGSSSSDLTVVQNFFVNMDSKANCVVKSGIPSFSCTIYFTTNKKINVNPSTTINVKASKFNFSGTYEGITTEAGSKDVAFGSSVDKSTINGLSLTIPSGYTRDGDDIYSDAECTISLGNSFYANSNPMTVYIKVKENAITITLKAFFSDYSDSEIGDVTSADNQTLVLNTDFGVNSIVTNSDLETLWKASIATSLTNAANNATYTFYQVQNSTHSAAFVDGTVADATTLYVRYVRDTYNVTLAPSYFVTLSNGSLKRLNIDCGQGTLTQEVLNKANFSTEQTFESTSYKDLTNGIWYTFTRADDLWYTDPNCSTPANGYSSAPTSSSDPGTLYAKMVCAKLHTYYIDVQQTGWNGCNAHLWDKNGEESDEENSEEDKFEDVFYNFCIIPDRLYRFSAPTTVDGLVAHNGWTGSNNQSNDLNMTDMSDNSYILVGGTGSDQGSNRWIGTFDTKEEVIGNSCVQIYENGNWHDILDSNNNPIRLETGDGVGNDFVYEHGLRLAAGSIIRIYDGVNAYGYNSYVEANKDIHKYLKSHTVETAGDSIELTSFTNNARFNFYLTHASDEADRKLSIAMVPDYGNGYYIMNYNSNLGTNNFIGAIKMDSNEFSASYVGYYSAGGVDNKIFIRSYVNGVDTLCSTLANTSSDVATIDDGVITFTGSGHFNVYVTGSSVTITKYSSDDFFSLNFLDTSTVTSSSDDEAEQILDKQTAIWEQKTTLILEVPFTCDNPYSSSISLLTEGGVSYIGVNLYVSETRLGDGDSETIYNTLRGADSPSTYYTGLVASNSTSAITNKNTLYSSVDASDSNTHYAYIIIDYMYNITEENVLANAPEIKFYLQSNQI